ncbi:hypothetical protein TURU_010996 [Turdus rufiventris]|nr:hypothetical protein TURU_010996 [Turdus rufiventris]
MECPSNEDHEEGDGTAIVTPATQKEPSLVGEEAADQDQASTYTIPFSTFLDSLGEGNQMWHRKAVSILQKVLIAAQGKGEQKRKHPIGSKEVLKQPAQSIRAEGLDKGLPVKQGTDQQLVEEEPDRELSMKKAIEAGIPAGPAFRSLSPTVIDALAQERRTSVFKNAPRTLSSTFSAMHRRGEWEQQQPTACAQDLPDIAQCISSEVLSKTAIVIQGLQQTEEQEYLAHSMDSTLAVKARAAGAVNVAHDPHRPIADGLALLDTAPDMRNELLRKAVIVIRGPEEHMEEQGDLEQGSGEGMKVTASAEGTKRPGHTMHSRTAEVLAFLDYNDYILTEVVKKAMLMVQKPFECPEELQDQELHAEGSIMAETPAGSTQSPPVPAVINIPVRQRWLRLVRRILKAQPLASTATSLTGEVEKKHPTADGKDLQDTAECIRRDVLDKVTLDIQGSGQQIVEVPNVESSKDVSREVTATAAGTKSCVHEIHSPTADVPVFLNAADYMHTEVVKKAVLVVQKPFDKPEEPWEQEQSVDEEMVAKARVTEAGRQTHIPHSPRAHGPVLLDTAQYIPAPAECTERPGHTTHSPTADVPVFLNAADYMHNEVVKKAVLVVQRPFDKPEELQEQEQSVDEGMVAKTRAAEAGRQSHVPCSPRAHGPVLLDTAQYIPAPAKGTERPGHTMQSRTADAPIFLDYNDFLQTEVVKKAVLVVPKPLKYPE